MGRAPAWVIPVCGQTGVCESCESVTGRDIRERSGDSGGWSGVWPGVAPRDPAPPGTNIGVVPGGTLVVPWSPGTNIGVGHHAIKHHPWPAMT